MPKHEWKPGDYAEAWFVSGFTRRCKILSIDQDGLASVIYPDYPQLGVDYVMVRNLS